MSKLRELNDIKYRSDQMSKLQELNDIKSTLDHWVEGVESYQVQIRCWNSAKGSVVDWEAWLSHSRKTERKFEFPQGNFSVGTDGRWNLSLRGAFFTADWVLKLVNWLWLVPWWLRWILDGIPGTWADPEGPRPRRETTGSALSYTGNWVCTW